MESFTYKDEKFYQLVTRNWDSGKAAWVNDSRMTLTYPVTTMASTITPVGQQTVRLIKTK